MWLPHGGRAVSFALILTLAVEHAAKRGRSTGPLHCGRRLQVNQVIVRLAHPRVLALVPPPEEELGTLLKEAACSGEAQEIFIEKEDCVKITPLKAKYNFGQVQYPFVVSEVAAMCRQLKQQGREFVLVGNC